MRTRGLAWSDRLFLILLAVSLGCFGISRFLNLRFFVLPAMVIMTPRGFLAGTIETVASLKRENQRLSELCLRAQMDAAYWRDRAGLATHDSFSARYGLRSAEIVCRDPQSLYSTLVVNQGLLDGVRNDMAAVTDAGVAGRVVEAGLNLSFVATVHNPRVKIAALDLRSRVAGIIAAREGSLLLSLEYVPPDADLAVGDTIMTSGTGGVFPKGLLVGRVVRTDSAPKGMFRPVTVKAFVNVAATERLYLVEPNDWSRIEQERQAALQELDARKESDLRAMLEGAQVETK